jgi:2-methylfumaryl-CoA isomerase
VGEATGRPLQGLRVVEVSSFVAAPLSTLVLAQLGAEVVRVDPHGGAADIDRWPIGPNGRSLFWTGLNRGKHSVTMNMRSEEDREALVVAITAPGDGNGVFVTNLPPRHWLSDELLRDRRSDLIHVRIQGTHAGGSAVDYTVNASTGLPYITGPVHEPGPVNHVLPAWDLLCGMHAALAVTSAYADRHRTGRGAYLTVALEDVALSLLTTVGLLPEADLTRRERERAGNFLYGSFSCDIELSDGSRILVVALTERQWHNLLEATGAAELVSAVASQLQTSFESNGERYQHRDLLAALLRQQCRGRTASEQIERLKAAGALWAPFRHMPDVAAEAAQQGSIVQRVIDQIAGPMLGTGSPIRADMSPVWVPPAPVLGEHTELMDRYGIHK